MIIFIDESGDPGFKVGIGSSEVFVVALVIFDDLIDAENTAKKIKKLRQDLGRNEKSEFKFSKCNKVFRCKFLSIVADSKFRVRAIVMPKKHIHSGHLRKSKEAFYSYTIKTVLKNNQGTISNAKIKLDGRGDRKFKNEMNKYLRNELNNPMGSIFNNLQFVDSHTDVLIQLADMVAGAIHRSYYEDKPDKDLYRGIIAKRIEDQWMFS